MDDLFGLNDNPIDRFINRFGTAHGHLEMSYHAALPLALTPDLLYLIWANFRSDIEGQPLNMQWVTVADLILSPLCREIRHETYVMETAVRQELLNRMAQDERFGPEYILRLGQFVQHYASQYIQSDIPSLRQFAQAQVWAAQAYTEPERLLENLAGQYSQQLDEAETVRLAELLDTFSEPLNLDWVPTTVETAVNYDRLHTFGDGLAKFARGDTQSATRQLRQLLGPARELNIGTLALSVPAHISQALANLEEKIFTYRVRVQSNTAVTTQKIDSDGNYSATLTGKLTIHGTVEFQTRQTNRGELQEFGQELFDILFSDEVLRDDFLEFFKRAFNERAFLRLELDIDANRELNLTFLPWELLHLPSNFESSNGWLSAAPESMLSRHLWKINEPISTEFLPSNERIRIAVIAGPQAYHEFTLAYDATWEAYEALARLYPDQFTLLPLLTDATPDEINDLLDQQPHVVHFINHAQLLESNGRDRGQIALTRYVQNGTPDRTRLDFDPDPEWFDGNALASLFNRHQPALVLLQSGEVTHTDWHRGLRDVAALLAESDIPAVLSWQFPVEESSIVKFIHTVFPALARGVSLDEAVQNGRRVLLRDENPLAFAAPSLFSNAIVRRSTVNEPAPFILPISLGVTLADSDVTTILEKGVSLPARSGQITLISSIDNYSRNRGFQILQLLGFLTDNPGENHLLGEIKIEVEPLLFYSDNIKLEITVNVDNNNYINLQVSHESGYSENLTISLPDLKPPIVSQVLDFSGIISRYSQDRIASVYTNIINLMSDWLEDPNASRNLILTGNDSTRKTAATVHIQTFLSNIQRLGASFSKFDNSLLLALRRAREYTNAPRIFAILIAGDNSSVNVYQLLSTGKMHLRQINNIPVGLIADTLQSNKTNLITNAGEPTSQIFKTRFYAESRCGLAVPIRVKGNEKSIAGTLYLESPKPEGLTLDHARFLESLGQRLAIQFEQLELSLEESGEILNDLGFSGSSYQLKSASYFCQTSILETINPRNFTLTIASQLLSNNTDFTNLQTIIENNKEYELDELISQLIIQPFSDINPSVNKIIVLIDDLESASKHSEKNNILEIIRQMLDKVPAVRFLLTTQMQPTVQNKLGEIDAQYISLNEGYDNFDIHFGLPLPGTDMRYPLIVSSETNGELRNVEQTFSPVAELGYERLARLRDLASNSEDVLEIGQRLFSVLMREPNYQMMRRSLNAAINRGKEGLRVRVRFDDPALQSYPWELCHNGESFIFNNPDQPVLLQRLVGTENHQAPRALPRPTRLLVAISAPVDLGQADVDLHEKVIREATEEVVTSSELDLQILRHVTLNELLKAAQSYQPDIVYFITPSSAEKEGAFILENESGRSNRVPINEIMRVLGPLHLHCILLSPIAVGESAVTQLAHQLTRQGIPTVLASQLAVLNQKSSVFLSAFYRKLLFERLSFEEALWKAGAENIITQRQPYWSQIAIFKGQQSTSRGGTIEIFEEYLEGHHLVLDNATSGVWVNGKLTPQLTELEFRLLKILYQRANEVVEKDDLIIAGWPNARGGVSDEALVAAMARLRKKIEIDPRNPQFIENVLNRGYRLQIGKTVPKVRINGEVIPALTVLEFRLLKILYERANEVVEKDDLISAGWPSAKGGVSDEALIAAIARLRKKIEVDPRNPQFIKNVLNQGYLLQIGKTESEARINEESTPQLTELELRLLKILYQHANDVIEKDDLITAGWPNARGGVSDEALIAAMARLRKKIELDPKKPRFLKNVHNRGYRLQIDKSAQSDIERLVVGKESLYFDEPGRQIWVYGNRVPRLTQLEYRLFEILHTQKGEVVTKQELISAGWPHARGGVSDDALIAAIARLRKKIEPDASNPRFILTKPNEGYRLVISPTE